MFYFAWVDSDESTFGPEHHVHDEDPFNIRLEQVEGDFASLSMDIINPRVGLLTSGRKRWAWLSYRKQDTTVVPLFFGRLVGVPSEIQDNVVNLTFIARPPNYEELKAALASTLRVTPYYDAVWIAKESRSDPDAVLEGRPSLYHIDRVTHAVTISDIITGEDSQLDFEEDDAFYDSVKVSFSEAPAKRCVVTASVNWQQYGTGDIDITQDLIAAFQTEGFPGLYDIRLEKRDAPGTIAVVPGEDLIKNWPKFGDRIGGGWTVGVSSATLVGNPPTPPIITGNHAAYSTILYWNEFRKGSVSALRQLFDRAPGFVVEIEDTTSQTAKSIYGDWGMIAHGEVHIMWVPVWRIAPKLVLHWEAARERTETVTFTVDADVQDVISDPGEDAIIYMDAGAADVDEFVADARRPYFLKTDRGRRALSALVARARAALLMRARCVEVTFSVPFEHGLDLSCRRSVSLQDPRLPEGIAAGKVKGYSLTVDGESGVMLANITMACSVGRNGSVVAIPGTPVYVDSGYVESGYQEEEDEVIVPIAGAVGYSLAYTPADDGVDLYRIGKAEYLTELEVEGTLEVQQAAAQDGAVEATGQSVMDKINGYKTRIRLTTKPVSGGPFETSVFPVMTELKVPRTINLET